MAVTVITKKRGRPLVTGEVGVSIINWKDKYSGVVLRFQQIGSVAQKKLHQRLTVTHRQSGCDLLERKQAYYKDNREK